MKRVFIGLVSLMAAFSMVSCEYDNYAEPNATLTGRIVYNGTPLSVKNNEIKFLHLYEEGWELSSSTYLDVAIAQDGSFSSSVFKGKDYYIELQQNAGPWVNPASGQKVDLKSYDGKSVDVEVTPYFILDNSSISCASKVITATADVKQIADGAQIEKVGLYVSRNIICDNVYSKVGNVENKTVAAGDKVSLSIDLSSKSVNSTIASLPSTGFVYARLGLKVKGITPMIYTEPVKINF